MDWSFPLFGLLIERLGFTICNKKIYSYKFVQILSTWVGFIHATFISTMYIFNFDDQHNIQTLYPLLPTKEIHHKIIFNKIFETFNVLQLFSGLSGYAPFYPIVKKESSSINTFIFCKLDKKLGWHKKREKKFSFTILLYARKVERPSLDAR